MVPRFSDGTTVEELVLPHSKQPKAFELSLSSQTRHCTLATLKGTYGGLARRDYLCKTVVGGPKLVVLFLILTQTITVLSILSIM